MKTLYDFDNAFENLMDDALNNLSVVLNNVAETIGVAFMLAGAFVLASLVLGALARLSAELWMEASRRWRDIFKAERLICEYKREREQYLKWKEGKER